MAERADIAITAGGTAVGVLRDASVQLTLGLVEAAAEDAYGARRVVPGAVSWSASGSTFLPTGGDAGQTALLTALTGRTTVTVAVTFEDAVTETGSARVTGWAAEGSVGEALTGTFNLQGTGALIAS